jgi:hypothetical protein
MRRYQETSFWPWWAVITCLGLIALIGASFDRALGELAPWVGWVVGAIGLTAMLWAMWATRLRISVDENFLHVNQARLPRQWVGRVVSANANSAKELRTTKSDARAFMASRPWLAGAVLVEITDSSDPHPYWYVSCKRPDSLERALIS